MECAGAANLMQYDHLSEVLNIIVFSALMFAVLVCIIYCVCVTVTNILIDAGYSVHFTIIPPRVIDMTENNSTTDTTNSFKRRSSKRATRELYLLNDGDYSEEQDVEDAEDAEDVQEGEEGEDKDKEEISEQQNDAFVKEFMSSMLLPDVKNVAVIEPHYQTGSAEQHKEFEEIKEVEDRERERFETAHLRAASLTSSCCAPSSSSSSSSSSSTHDILSPEISYMPTSGNYVKFGESLPNGDEHQTGSLRPIGGQVDVKSMMKALGLREYGPKPE